MPVAALCPSCKAPLNEASVIALAPVCTRCGVVITSTGGTLGATSAYGVSDPSITRRRVEADLAVFLEYLTKYRGMLEDCKQKLNWGVERYAKFPPQPELLQLKEVPPLLNMNGCWYGLGFGIVAVILIFWVAMNGAAMLGVPDKQILRTGNQFMHIWMFTWWILIFVPGPFIHFKAKAANGNRPAENARRQKAYENARIAALNAAVPLKEAEDHRLRVQIRELEGLIKTVGDKAADIRRIMATL